MKNYLLIFVLGFCIFSCNEDNSISPTDDQLSVIIGDHIYYLVEGNNQEGVPGSILEEIKIVVTDLSGRRVSRNLSFELSDESGSVSVPWFSNGDTLTVNWRLGCNLGTQILKVKDSNVCGIKKNECIEVDIFDITASAEVGEVAGWVSPCSPTTSSYYHIFSSNDQIAYVDSERAYTTNDPVGINWNSSGINSTLNFATKRITTTGTFYYIDGNSIGILGEDGNWLLSSSPYGSSNFENRIEVTSQGEYFMANEYSTVIYKSADGINWSFYLDINDETGGGSFDPQAITTVGNELLIVSDNNYVIKANTSSNTITTYSFANYWSRFRDLGDFKIQANTSQILLMENYEDEMLVINLSTNSVQTIGISYNSTLHKSDGDLFVIEDNFYVKEWTGSSLSDHTYSGPTDNSFQVIGMYNGSPIVIDFQSILYIFVNP